MLAQAPLLSGERAYPIFLQIYEEFLDLPNFVDPLGLEPKVKRAKISYVTLYTTGLLAALAGIEPAT